MGRNVKKAPIAATQSAGRRPNQVPSAPPSSAPSGMVPQTRKRMTAFIRPCMRSGQIACRKLSCVML